MRITGRSARVCAVAAVVACAGCMSGGDDAKTRAPSHTASPALPLAAGLLHGSALPRGSVTPSSPLAIARHADQPATQPAKDSSSNVAPPADPRPYILGAGVSPSTVGSGTAVSARVRTTPGVVAVTAYAAGSSLSLARIAAGQFAATTTLPMLPPGVHGVFAVTFVARDARGRSTQTAVNVSVR